MRDALRLGVALTAVLMLSGCGGSSAKSVSWDEEVRLNTGEVLWIKRTDNFQRRSVPGNPLQMGWWPDVRTYEFAYRNRNYLYRTNPADSLGALMLFARGDDVMVIDATRACGKPGYAEFRWDGQRWQARNVGPDAIGQPRNLMQAYSEQKSWGDRISTQDKVARDASPAGPRVRMALEASQAAPC